MWNILGSLRELSKVCIGGLLAIGGIHLALAQTLPVTSAGYTPGTFDVSSTGQATYTVPLWTPPGVNGVEPKVSLSYSSNNRSTGWISPGWSLSGLSQITRCQKTVEYDGVVTPIYLNKDDVFCLDGQRLELNSGGYGEPGSSYRAKIERFSRIVARDAAGNGPAWFEVTTKEGLIYEYGNTANSRAYLAGDFTPYLWALSKIRDRQGNNLIVDYATSSGALAPTTIQYTQTPAIGASYPYTIVFGYATRDSDDTLTGYIAGRKYSINRRLTSVDVRYGGTSGTLLRQYRLTYTDSPTTQHSRLAFVQECAGGSGADCLAPTAISYQDGQNGIAAPVSAVGSLPAYNELRIADVNDDGRSDLVYSTGPNASGYYEWYVSLAAPQGFGAPINTGILIAASDPRSELLIGDFLGIGSVQLLAPDPSSKLWCSTRWDSGFVRYCSDVGVDPLAAVGNLPGDGNGPSYAAADINGDGRSDLVWASLNNVSGVPLIYGRLSVGLSAYQPSFGAQTYLYPIPDSFVGLYGSYGPTTVATATDRMDFNGDSREDAVLVTASSSQIQVVVTARQLIAGPSGFSTGPTLGNHSGWPRAVHWNDDACTDMQFSGTVYLSACNGAFGEFISAPDGYLRLDWNGDGRTDVLYPSGSSYVVRLSQGAQASAEMPTGIPYSTNAGLIPLDYDADGLVDLMSLNYTTRTTAVGLHLGAATPADLLSSVVDGNGNRFSPTYKPITQAANYQKGFSAYPNVTRMTALYVVDQFSASDGTGGTYTNQFRYAGARWNVRGQGFLGFLTKRTIDGRSGLHREVTYSQDIYTAGWPKTEYTMLPDGGTLTQATYHTLAVNPYYLGEIGPVVFFPYIQRSVTYTYAVGGSQTGIVNTRDVTNSYDTWGTPISQTVKTTEGSMGLNSGAEYTEIITATNVLNDTFNWCLGRPGRIQHTRRNSLATGTQVTRTFAYNWDAAQCRLNQEVVEPDSTRWAATTDYGYDDVGNINLVRVTPAAGQGQSARTSTIHWGTSGRFPTTITNAKSQVTVFGWDEMRAVRTSVTDPNTLATTTAFDNFNRPTRELFADGTATDTSYRICSSSFVYCAAADVRTFVQVVARDTANNAIRTDIQSYDAMDRPRYTYRQLLSGAMSGEITTYNPRGFVASVSMPFIQGEPVWYTTITYDALGRPRIIQRPISEANTSNHLTQFSYEGLSTVETDALNRPTTRWVNAIGEMVRVVDTGNGTTNYEYDAFGNLLKVRDPAGNETGMTYNVRGMKMTSTDPDAGAWSYDYYPLGELKSQTDAKSQTTTFTYDALSRLLTRVDGDGTVEFTYDTAPKGVGQRATATSPGYAEAYSYDAFGRLSQTRITADANTYQYDYGYNATTGLLQYLTYPTSSSGFRFKVRYDYQYGLVQKVSDYSADVQGTAWWEGIATNARGQYIDEQYGNGLRTISGYDRIAGWLDDRTTGRTGGTSLQNFTYQWNALGNLTQRQDSYNHTTENFYYDALDRLDYSTLNGTTNLDLAYDAIGNITSKSGVGSYTYHPIKRHAVVSTTGTINNSYTYDANGNMETRNGQPITWYRNNLPKKISASAGVSNEFWYGPQGARWKQVIVNGSTTGTLTYVGAFVERLVTANVNEFRHYVHGPDGVVAVYKRPTSGSTPTTTYVTTDHLGSLDVITNTAGVEGADAAFSAFGERVHYNGSGPPTADDLRDLRNATGRGFTFHEHLDESGLIHMNGRVYDPVIARFISPDPFVQDPFNSQSLNRYSYVLNNPLRYTDPTGYWSFREWSGSFLRNLNFVYGLYRWGRELYREGCRGDLCGRTQNPPQTPPAPTPPPQYVRPPNPTLPPADTAIPGIGQSADAVNLQPGDADRVCQSAGYMYCLPATRSRADAIADEQAEIAVEGSLVIAPAVVRGGIEAVRAIQAARAAARAARAARLIEEARAARLLEEARAARDALAGELAPLKGRAPATVTGGYNVRTGQVAARACSSGRCAEDNVVEALGGNKADVRFTEAVRPRTGAEVPVCPRCEVSYGREAFPPDTTFRSGPMP